jgi:hypothetical protein
MPAVDGPVRRRLQQRPHDPACALLTPASARPAATARPPATPRWRRETVLAATACLGGTHLPALQRHALQPLRARRRRAFHGVDTCRQDRGAASQTQTPELSQRAVVAGGQGRGQ